MSGTAPPPDYLPQEEARAVSQPARRPAFGEALGVWAKIGVLSFGGPAGQIALMHKMLVEERRWLSEQRFLTGLNFCMLLPGPEAQQLATYIGWLLHGVRGGIVAGTLFVLPGFFVLMTLSALYAEFHNTAWMGNLFFGLKAAVIAIVLEALLRIGKRALKDNAMGAIAAAAFVAIFAFGVPFPLIVLAAGLIGFFAFGRRHCNAPSGLAPRESSPVSGGGLRRSLFRSLRVLLVCGSLWSAPIVALLLAAPDTVFLPIAAFFSKMAVVTFGGAYAVLAYVAQEAAGPLGWLSPSEMLDGLAMAETTPGPLILVLVFVGFIAGFRDPGVLPPLAGGILGGVLTTWVTFVPCFLWIFLGAPYIEAIGRNRALSGSLAAITAAVVGVILNLSVWFALHALFALVGTLKEGPLSMPWPAWQTLDAAALGLTVAALILTFVLKRGMLMTLAVCAVLGYVWKTAI